MISCLGVRPKAWSAGKKIQIPTEWIEKLKKSERRSTVDEKRKLKEGV